MPSSVHRGIGAARPSTRNTKGRAVSSCMAPMMRVGKRQVAREQRGSDLVLVDGGGHAAPAEQGRKRRQQPARTRRRRRDAARRQHSSAITMKISRCRMHQGQGFMPKTCCETRAAPTAARQASASTGIRPADAAARVRSCSFHFRDQFDLDTGAHRDLRHAEGAARMGALRRRRPRPAVREQPLVTRCCSVKWARC